MCTVRGFVGLVQGLQIYNKQPSLGSRTKVQVDNIICLFPLIKKYYMMNDEGQESKIINNFARIDFCSKYKSFALLKL